MWPGSGTDRYDDSWIICGFHVVIDFPSSSSPTSNPRQAFQLLIGIKDDHLARGYYVVVNR